MPLKNDSFGFTRHWLVAAFRELPRQPDLFAAKKMSTARKSFLAGSNQLTAIKNWLKAGGVTESKGSNTTLTELGQLMAAQDARAEMAWTWWLFHLHLCTNPDAFPYTGFFHIYDTEGRWVSLDDITDCLAQSAEEKQIGISKETVSSYFSGVAQTFQTGGFVNELGLLEERTVGDGRGGRKVRRRLTKAEDLLVAYAAVLFQRQHYPNQATVEAREILGKGFARVLGLRESDVRESLSRITTHKDYGQFVQYRQQVNQDSIQFLRPAEATLRDLRLTGYRSHAVKWQ
ncbi:DUF4007 family protein [Gemmata sp. G18]|uniref:DUF4007 family protein n=1 Tax=Gemmata palustris TaxID=2822762 RepID=A0ABS5BNQ6_9BACT|nr:DUF4007 family protein [Gemmata palustris]MBP3955364.1 DUF4007 family protein [Gemmata palustris]